MTPSSAKALLGISNRELKVLADDVWLAVDVSPSVGISNRELKVEVGEVSVDGAVDISNRELKARSK